MKALTTLFTVLLVVSSAAAEGKTVNYKVDGKSYQGYYISSSSKAPLVLLIHDWDGLTDYEVKRARILARLGYSVFAADLFGTGVRPTKVKDKRQHTGELYKDRERMQRLIKGSLDKAKALGANIKNVVLMGYCFGGAAVLEYARTGADIKGFVTFHGGLMTPKGQDYSRTKGNILVLHGTADAHITMKDFAGLAEELEKHNVKHEMITYGGAPHAFTVWKSSRYRKDADQKSWARFLQFLKETTVR